jgi:hypothetical protein
MIKTVNGTYESEFGFEERPWKFGEGVNVYDGGETHNTTIVELELGPSNDRATENTG